MGKPNLSPSVASGAPERSSAAGLWVAGACLLATCFWFADRKGFEGDGLAFLFGIDNLALVGRDHVYRYHWQPLAYDLLSPLARFLQSPLQLMHLGTAFAATGSILLLVLLKRLLQPMPFALGSALILVLVVPELFVTSLYFNTTALALPFFTGCLLMLRHAGSAPMALGALAGALMAAACLFRLDFAACVPFTVLCLMRWNPRHGLQVLWPAVLGGIAVAGTFLIWQPSFVSSALSILGTFSDGEFPITMVGRLKIIVVTFGPALLILPLWLRHLRKLHQARAPQTPPQFPGPLWLLVSLLPTLVPLNNLYSGKYLVPFIVCLLVVLADAGGRAYSTLAAPAGEHRIRGQRWVRWSAGILLLSLLIGVPDSAALRQSPLLAFVQQPWRVGSHDGPRTAGAYLAYANWVRNFERRQDNVVMFRQLAEVIDGCGRNTTVAMSSLPKYGRNEWSWGFLPLYLEDRGWTLASYTPAQTARLVHRSSGRTVTIWRHDLVPASAPADTFMVDFDDVLPLEGEDFWVKSRRWVESTLNNGPCLALSSKQAGL